MAERPEVVLATIDAGSRPVYEFVERNEYSIILREAESPAHHVVIDKQALAAFARKFSELARRFTV